MNVDDLHPKVEQAAQLLGMMAHEHRLRILCTLLGGEWSVVRLAEELRMSQPNLSHHLKKLRECGLVQTRRDAQTIHYRLQGEAVEMVLHVLHRIYCSPAEST
jgi:ArsR family transcriptional regulator, virulence genes transcriptional regulator